MRAIGNFIGGKEQDALDGTFTVQSQFFPYEFEVANSGRLDLGDCIAAAKNAQAACAALSIDERKAVLRAAAQQLVVADDEIDHLVEMGGMPITFVRQHAAYARNILALAADVADVRHGFVHGMLGDHVMDKGFEISLPPEGLVCALIPPNDPAESAFIFAHVVMSGAVVILKPSQQEPYMALKLAALLTACGYPAGGLNVLHWNTKDLSRAELVDELVKQTQYRIVMGEYETAHAILAGGQHTRARNCVFSAGRSKAIVDEGADIVKAADCIVASSLDWTSNCVSTKTVVVVGEHNARALITLLAHKFLGRRVGDPRDAATQIGYVPQAVLDQMEQSVRGAGDFNYIDILVPFERLNKHQIRPLLVTVSPTDEESSFVTQELPYTLAVVTVPTFTDAVSFVNRSTSHLHERHNMAVSLYGGDASFEEFAHRSPLKAKEVMSLRTFMLFYNRPSTELTPYLRHQGMDLTAFLARPLSIIEPEAS